MASSSGTGEPSAIPIPASGEQEQKTPAARRNISRSEEDDSDDSGVIRDVARRLTVEAKSPEAEVKKGMESAEAEVSLGSPRPKESIDDKKKEENKEETKDEKKEEKKEEKKVPPKKSYLDYIEQKPKPVLRFHVGDLVWVSKVLLQLQELFVFFPIFRVAPLVPTITQLLSLRIPTSSKLILSDILG